MAVARSNSSSESSIRGCNYYKIAGLGETILGAEEISNLKDRYALGEQLGWGQFGVIRACSHKSTGELLACKSIAKDRLVTSDDVNSVKLEIEIMTRLSGHPNVVNLKEVYEEENYVHLVMELCAGGELFHQIEEHGRFSEAEALVLFRHLMRVVLYCHEKGVVHRDLKPENILLATKASSSPIKLADFGLATYIKPGQSLHGTVGSPFYIAPEVLSGGYNQSADIWSAGVILYILLSGMPPFWGKTKSRIFDAVRIADLRFPSSPWDCISASAKALIKGMLCVDPSQRLTAQEVLEHSWMDDCGPNVQVLNLWEQRASGGFDDRGVSFSATHMPRDQDISFGNRTHITSEAQSPTYTCRSSFSSFFPEPSTLCLGSGGFSFRSCGSSGALEFSSPIPSMPSFSFFSPGSMNGQGSAPSGLLSDASADGEARSGKLLTLPSSSLVIFNHLVGEEEEKIAEVKRGGGMTEHRVLGIHSKRNRTIGLGERDQLDLVVTESVIRWSSCTLIPTSLRSSLVC